MKLEGTIQARGFINGYKEQLLWDRNMSLKSWDAMFPRDPAVPGYYWNGYGVYGISTLVP
jgi:hypothetical protein